MTLHRITLPLPLAARSLAALAVSASAQTVVAQDIDPTIRPDYRSISCVTSGCHAGTLDHEFLHGPTAVFDCRACHEDLSVADHTFTIKTEGRGLCDFCHIDKAGTEGPVVHQPLADGECLGCHDPHGSSHRKMLKFDSMGELCTSCHTETMHGSMLHEPAAVGDCTACHSPHTADHAGLLVEERRALCVSCHAETNEHIIGALTVHEPVMGDCSECHLPHASDHPALMPEDTVGMCTSCHQEQLAAAQDATHPHSAVLEGQACLSCHQPHASAEPALQFDDPVAACLVCHSDGPDVDEPAAPANPAAPVIHTSESQTTTEPIDLHKGGRVSDIADHLPYAHGPVIDAECGACHEVHGSQHSRLLIANYTEKFYEPFNTDAYALCLSCHDANLMLEDHTFEATRFRDQGVNLHALHVKGPEGDQGRTCRACHNTHASNHKAMVRDGSPYGQWTLPINFIPDEFGGSCAPGCHKPAAYTRNDAPEGYSVPVPKLTIPAQPPAATPPQTPTRTDAAGE